MGTLLHQSLTVHGTRTCHRLSTAKAFDLPKAYASLSLQHATAAHMCVRMRVIRSGLHVALRRLCIHAVVLCSTPLQQCWVVGPDL